MSTNPVAKFETIATLSVAYSALKVLEDGFESTSHCNCEKVFQALADLEKAEDHVWLAFAHQTQAINPTLPSELACQRKMITPQFRSVVEHLIEAES